MSYDSAYRAEIESLAYANLTGISSANTYWTSQINRQNLQNLLQDGKITAPFCVIELGPSSPEDYAADGFSERIPTDIYYVVDSQVSSDVTSYVATQANTFIAAIWNGKPTSFQVLGTQPTYDASDTNPANKVIFQANRPLYAVQISLQALVGGYG